MSFTSCSLAFGRISTDSYKCRKSNVLHEEETSRMEMEWTYFWFGIKMKVSAVIRPLSISHVLIDSWPQSEKCEKYEYVIDKKRDKLPDTLTVSRTADLPKSHTNCTSPCWNADQCSRTLFSCSHPVQHNVYCGISEEPLLGAITSSNIWHANFSDCKYTDTCSCRFLDVLISHRAPLL